MARRSRSKAPTTTAKLPAGDPGHPGLDVLAALFGATQDGMVFLDRHFRCVFANPAACTLLGYALDKMRRRDFLTGLGLDQPHVWDGLAAGKSGRWEAVLRRPDGSELDIECTATRLDCPGKELMMVILRDDSERRQQAREAAALAQAAARVAVSDSIDATVQALAESALRATRALGVTVVLDDEEELAVWIGAAGMPDGYADSFRVLFDDVGELAAWIGAAGLPDGYADSLRAAICAGYRLPALQETCGLEPQILVDRDPRRRVESDPRRAGLTESDTWKSIPWQAAVFAPLIYQGEVVGTLSAIYREDELPLGGEMAFLGRLADQAAVAAMNARFVTDTRAKVALEERQRLSRELHDSVAPTFYGIGLGARTARDLLEHDPARAAEPVDYVLQLAEVGITEMRALIFELRPEPLETEGLIGALDKQVEALRARHGIAARTIAQVEPMLSLEGKQALYRIAQEALQNMVKHAQAGSVEVRLEAQDGEVRLAIEDDGVGFEPDGTFPGHLGLCSMRERALGVGGSLEVASAPGHGTRILVSVPLPPQAHTTMA